MRIVLANNYLYYRGGAERVFLDQRDLFRRKGHEVFLFGLNHPNNLPGMDWEALPDWNDPKKYGFLNGLPRFLRFAYSPENGRLFRKFLEKTRPDLVHVHNIYGGLTTAILDEARAFGVPVVMTLHDYKILSPSPNLVAREEPCRDCLVRPGTPWCLLQRCHRGGLKSTLAYYAETWFNRRFDKYGSVRTFLVPSGFMSGLLSASGLEPGKIHVVFNSVEEPSEPPSPKPRGPVLYAARMTAEKGLPVLLKAAKDVGCRLVLAGDGPEMEEYWRMARGLADVRFTGHQGKAKMLECFRDCSAVVVPSLWPETSSMVILQAMANGKPVIASRIGALPELVEEGVTGFLFDPGDHGQLRSILKKLQEDPELGVRMGARGLKAFQERFSQERQYEDLMVLYEDILGRPLR